MKEQIAKYHIVTHITGYSICQVCTTYQQTQHKILHFSRVLLAFACTYYILGPKSSSNSISNFNHRTLFCSSTQTNLWETKVSHFINCVWFFVWFTKSEKTITFFLIFKNHYKGNTRFINWGIFNTPRFAWDYPWNT